MNGKPTFPELIGTQRLELRQYADADAATVLAVIDRNRDQLMQNFAPLARLVRRPSDAEKFVEESANKRDARKEFCYGIWQRSSKDLIGQIKVKSIAWEIPSAELSYFVDAAARRQGFACEALCALLRVGFEQLGFQRIFLRIIASNRESLLLAEKLGFRQEGLHRNEFRCGFNVLHDVHHYALTATDALPCGTHG